MDSVLSGTYLFVCLATILVVCFGIFAPNLAERYFEEALDAERMVNFHCKVFGWSIFLGGLGILFSLLFEWWSGFRGLFAAELTLFGFAYFIGLWAHEQDKKAFRARCRSVHKRYIDSLMAFFATREERKHVKPDLEFMKKVEVHALCRPEHTIAMRIHFARCLLGLHYQTYELEIMVISYVRAGGMP